MNDRSIGRRDPVAELNLAFVGFGHVATRFVQLLDERRDELYRDEGLVCRIVGVATGRHGTIRDEAGLDLHQLLPRLARGDRLAPESPHAAGSVELIREVCRRLTNVVVVETTPLDIRAGQPGIDHIRTALESGADVVTANKGPIAFAYHELLSTAAAHGRSLLFEGIVMDGVPIFNLVREALPAVEIRCVLGVLNSTTNYILSAMERGWRFDEALVEMQRAGIAEADPSLDVDGWDASAKVAALANVLLGARVTPHDVTRTGIRDITPARVRQARDRGRRIRLVARAEGQDGRVAAAVEPVELDEQSLLARLEGMQNALILTTDLLGDIAVTELDGGLTQTAYALLSDLVTIRRRMTAPLRAPGDRSP